ncbi:2-deoxy-5-keto-D-gluconate 6-phosphate aldolase domain-containing protein [Terrarubrum flagellatum]|uniref:2-deoxy-5-keto-D-gluconate 6-phosphate aldolase domain-containing protein n=1 Tax=Terrirubrum flagellatum TaxID=2895980 RepID=UPI0031456ED5
MSLRILSIDHRVPLIELADKTGAPRERLSHFKKLVVDAALEVAQGRNGFGVFLDGGYGAPAIAKAQDARLFIARPIDAPHALPLQFEGGDDLASTFADWPAGVTVKCAVYLHPQDSRDILTGADRALAQLHAACEQAGLRLLLEVLASPHGPVDERTVAGLIAHFYGLGVKPHWWLIEDQPGDGWTRCGDLVRAHDSACEGFLTIARTIDSFPAVVASSRREPLVKGFCAGRSMFGATLEPWLKGAIDDQTGVAAMVANFATVVAAWDAPGAHPSR